MYIMTRAIGKKLITLDDEFNLSVKDINSSKNIFNFRVKSPQISSFDKCSQNLIDVSKQYVVIAHHSKIFIYDIKSGEKIKTWLLNYSINCNTTFVKLYSDKVLVINSNNEIKLFDMATSKLDYKITSRNDIKRVDIINNYLIVIDRFNSAEIFNLDKGVIYKKINKNINSINEINENIYCISDKKIELLDEKFNVSKIVFQNEEKISDIKPYKDHYVLKFDEMFALYSNEFVFVKEIEFDDKIVDMFYDCDSESMVFLLENDDTFTSNHTTYNNQVQEYLELDYISESQIKELYKLKNCCLVALNNIDVDYIIKKCFNKTFVSSLKLMANNNNDFAIRNLEKWVIFEEYKTFLKEYKRDIVKYPFVKKFYKEKKYALLENIVKQHKTLLYSPEYLKYKKEFNNFCEALRNSKNKLSHAQIIEKADPYLRVVENNRVILKILGS